MSGLGRSETLESVSEKAKMRIVATALGLCVAVTASCSSSKRSPEPTAPPGAETADAAGEGEQQPQTSGDYAQRQAELFTLAEQKKRFLVESHLQRAGELKERLELEQAEQELAKALQLDPDNLEAKSMLLAVVVGFAEQDDPPALRRFGERRRRGREREGWRGTRGAGRGAGREQDGEYRQPAPAQRRPGFAQRCAEGQKLT